MKARVEGDHKRFRAAAALEALGVLPQAESDALRAHLHACSKCREEYRGLRPIADLVGHKVYYDDLRAEPADAAALKARVMRAALAARPPKSTGPFAVRAVPTEQLIDYAPGIKWAVVPASGATIVYWSFDPPECGEIPTETHHNAQLGVVLQGSMSLTTGAGGSQRYGPSEFYSIAPGMQHGAHFDEPTVLVDVYTPNHTEFEELYAAQSECLKKA